jgi:hypothetical protein
MSKVVTLSVPKGADDASGSHVLGSRRRRPVAHAAVEDEVAVAPADDVTTVIDSVMWTPVYRPGS